MKRIFIPFLAALSCTVNSKSIRPDLYVVTEHLPPFQVISDNYGVGGFATEVIHEVINRTAYSFQLNSYSWTRSYNLAKRRKNTCIYSMAKLPSRVKHFQWIGSITLTNSVLFGVDSANAPKINTLSDAKNYTIAVIRDDVTHIALLEQGFVENENLYVVDSTSSLFRLVVARPDIDFIIADDITIAYRARLAGVDMNKIKRIFEIDNLPLNFYFACSLTTEPQIVSSLQQAMLQIKQDGTYQTIINRWRKVSPLLSQLD